MTHTTSRRTRGRMLAVLILAAVTATVTATAAFGSPSTLNGVRAATARFHSLTQAGANGYGLPPEGVPLHECIMSLDGSGGMGLHYINGGLLDAELDALNPEALIYAPDDSGRLRLVAVEYVTFQDAWEEANGPADFETNWPSLFGEKLTLLGAGNRYDIPAFFELHAWIWQTNSEGTFADFNPDVSCG
jgi:hypothetical protein